MSNVTGIDNVKRNIDKIYARRKAALYALAISYAGQALSIFRKEQAEQTFWNNRTNQAYQRVFSKAFKIDKKLVQDEIGFFLSHGVIYGIYLELANDRKNEALRPIMMSLAPKFIADAKKIVGAIN